MADSSSALPGSTHKELNLNDVRGHGTNHLPTKGLIANEEATTKGKSKLHDDDDASVNGNKYGSGSDYLNNNHVSSSDLVYHDDDLADEEDGDDEYMSDYEMDDDAYLYEDEYTNLQSQFDNVDLPTGVEVSMPWMDAVENTAPVSDGLAAGSSISATNGESSSSSKVQEVAESDVVESLGKFKQFDMVEDYSDHYFTQNAQEQAVPCKNWAKRIQEEWKILEENLPETIFVRVYESRMDLLRCVIVGPAGTPYHDGLFVFDCLFPSKYPNVPPSVHYYSGGLRLNPNLYQCGKVCLSLLGTWSGRGNEKWVAGKSTMLQVLVSIQALILNEQPFFNEPGYESSYRGEQGVIRSRKYNEDVFIMSLKTMIYTLRRPPKYFESLVKLHFRERKHDILTACLAYADGNTVGKVAINGGVPDVSNADKTGSEEFKGTVKRMVDLLIYNFSKFGSADG